MDSIIGKKFNRLTVLEETNKRTKQRTKIFLCRCDCGNFKEVAKEKLRHGTKSCGCLRNEYLKNTRRCGDAHKNWNGIGDVSKSFFSRIKSSAIQRNYIFELTIDDLWELFLNQEGKCALTGTSLELPVNVRKLRDKSDKRLASLDRIDNSVGYIKTNVRWICKRVNYMKHTMNDDEFLSWIKEIYDFKFKEKQKRKHSKEY